MCEGREEGEMDGIIVNGVPCSDFPDTVIEANNLTWGGISIVGEMKSGFPVPKIPQIADAGAIIVTAVFIMFIGFVESIAVAKTYSTLYK